MTRNNKQQDDISADGGSESYGSFRNQVGESEAIEEAKEFNPMAQEKQEFLMEAVKRAPILESLRWNSATASDIVGTIDMARSTVHRALDSLQEYELVEESNGVYELTQLGRIIVREIKDFSDCAGTARSITEFLNSTTLDGDRIPIEDLGDATVVSREPRSPHATIHRIMELFKSADELRMLSTVISPIYVDLGYKQMMNGMTIEGIFEPEVVELMLSNYPEKAHQTISQGNFTVYTSEKVPFELFIFDDKVGMAAHNKDGSAEVLIESDHPRVIDWAEDLYESHLQQADPINLPDA